MPCSDREILPRPDDRQIDERVRSLCGLFAQPKRAEAVLRKAMLRAQMGDALLCNLEPILSEARRRVGSQLKLCLLELEIDVLLNEGPKLSYSGWTRPSADSDRDWGSIRDDYDADQFETLFDPWAKRPDDL